MKNSIFIIIGSIILVLLIDIILYYQLRRLFKKKIFSYLYASHTIFFISIITTYYFIIQSLNKPEAYFWIETLIGILFLFYTPKLVFILLNGCGKLLGLFYTPLSKLMFRFAMIMSTVLFLILFYSITWGRYNYKLETVSVTLPQLPKAFDHFKIVQLSDLHLGSYSKRYRGVHKLVEEVNQLQPDVIFFTGDMVNNFAAEITPWIDVLKQMNAKYGKYAVTGNHDYGDYTRWKNQQAKEQNLNAFMDNMKAIGFKMLNNVNVPIVINRDTLYIAGVENWGKPPFPQYGNLRKALEGILHPDRVILLSHDPSHWKAEILDYPVPLTLSGHTHAMQMGIKIGKKKWSPAQYIYPEYDGLYYSGKQYLHVSRGQGYLGFPGRIGLRPVITEIVLHTSVNP